MFEILFMCVVYAPRLTAVHTAYVVHIPTYAFLLAVIFIGSFVIQVRPFDSGFYKSKVLFWFMNKSSFTHLKT